MSEERSTNAEWTVRARRFGATFRVPIVAMSGAVLLAVFAAVQVRSALHESRQFHASDGATILAFAGVRDFAERLDVEALMRIPLGADSMVMKARVFVGEQSMGTYAVNVSHVSPDEYRLRSTGRLVAAGSSTMCSLDVRVQLGRRDARPSLGVEREPLCNGLRHQSAVTRVRNIGS